MPQVCPKCNQLQPDGPRCLNCGAKFDVPLKTSQGTFITKQQLVDYGLALILLGGLIAFFFCGFLVLIVYLAR